MNPIANAATTTQQKNRNTFVQQVLAAKKNAEQRMQAFGGRIRNNIEQGQADLQSGKAQYYGAINPFK